MTNYLSLAQVVELHQELVEDFGGRQGIRDRAGLEAAVARPSMTFGGEDLYPDLPSKAAALFHSLTLNHPFFDGNERIAAAAAELMLDVNGAALEAGDEAFEAVTLATARGEMSAEALAIWFRQRSRAAEE